MCPTLRDGKASEYDDCPWCGVVSQEFTSLEGLRKMQQRILAIESAARHRAKLATNINDYSPLAVVRDRLQDARLALWELVAKMTPAEAEMPLGERQSGES